MDKPAASPATGVQSLSAAELPMSPETAHRKARVARPVRVEALETRDLPSGVSFALTDGKLEAIISRSDDVVAVYRNPTTDYIEFYAQNVLHFVAAAQDLREIHIRTLQGRDVIYIDPSLGMPTTIDAGPGGNTILGGKAAPTPAESPAPKTSATKATVQTGDSGSDDSKMEEGHSMTGVVRTLHLAAHGADTGDVAATTVALDQSGMAGHGASEAMSETGPHADAVMAHADMSGMVLADAGRADHWAGPPVYKNFHKQG